MARSLSEQQALKMLKIPDFRHLTKEKAVELASMLPQMSPEVAKAVLAQIPEYVKLATEIVLTYKNVIDKMHEANATDTKVFYDTCNRIILSLESQLRKENITEEACAEINNQMLAVAKMIGDKGKENKEYWLQVLGTFGKIALGLAAGALAIFGVRIFKNKAD